MQMLANVFRDVGLDLRVAARGAAIDPDESRPRENTYIAKDPVVLCIVREGIKSLTNGIWRNGLRKAIQGSHTGVAGLLRKARARFFDGLLDASRANSNLHVAQARTRNCQHQRRGIPEVALELNRPGALRKLAIQRVEFQIDVAELPLRITHA